MELRCREANQNPNRVVDLPRQALISFVGNNNNLLLMDPETAQLQAEIEILKSRLLVRENFFDALTKTAKREKELGVKVSDEFLGRYTESFKNFKKKIELEINAKQLKINEIKEDYRKRYCFENI